MEDNISISRKELLTLKLAEEKLNRLEAGGVDNWEGYWYSIHSTEVNENNWDNVKQEITDEVNKM